VCYASDSPRNRSFFSGPVKLFVVFGNILWRWELCLPFYAIIIYRTLSQQHSVLHCKSCTQGIKTMIIHRKYKVHTSSSLIVSYILYGRQQQKLRFLGHFFKLDNYNCYPYGGEKWRSRYLNPYCNCRWGNFLLFLQFSFLFWGSRLYFSAGWFDDTMSFLFCYSSHLGNKYSNVVLSFSF
jgi:hypothetical protein